MLFKRLPNVIQKVAKRKNKEKEKKENLPPSVLYSIRACSQHCLPSFNCVLSFNSQEGKKRAQCIHRHHSPLLRASARQQKRACVSVCLTLCEL